MPEAKKKPLRSEPFIFKLAQEKLPPVEDGAENQQPMNTRTFIRLILWSVVCLAILITLLLILR